MEKRYWLALTLLAALLVAAVSWTYPAQKPPIRIGVLHSLTGTMATSEQALVDAVRLAVEVVNAKGGLLGRPVEMVVVDGRSDDAVFAAEAERLITQGKVSALFACWTSSCRKAVKPVAERHQHLLFYPNQYEGLEQSQNIFYTGMVPTQQIMPGTRWAMERLGKRAYLLGSDYLYPRLAGRIIRDVISANGGTVLVERYRPLNETDFSDVVAELRALKPDVVFNNINGDSNQAFFRALRDAGLGELPVVSFSVAEEQAKLIGATAYHSKHYAVWHYFQSLPGEVNRQFVAAFQSRFGQERMTSAPVEAAYAGVMLWAQAVRDAGTDEPEAVNLVLPRQSAAVPSGIAAFDRDSRHLWRAPVVGKAQVDGQFEIVWNGSSLQKPRVFPIYRSTHEWLRLVRDASEHRS